MKNYTAILKLKDNITTYMLNDITDYNLTKTHLILRYGECLGDYRGDTQKIPLDMLKNHTMVNNRG